MMDQYRAASSFQRENNEICRIIGRQFIVAEWFLLRLTTTSTERGSTSTRRKTISREEMGLFLSSLLVSTANREDLFPIGRLVSFFFTSLLGELRHDFSSCSSPTPFISSTPSLSNRLPLSFDSSQAHPSASLPHLWSWRGSGGKQA